MSPIFNPSCGHCKNYLGNWNCQAYPEGIPEDIKNGSSKHKRIRKDQSNDVIFEPVK